MSPGGHIASYMKKVIDDYDNIRGKPRCKETWFWDIVVVTAVDEAQQKSYELQLAEKQKNLDVPLDVKYLVFSDPPGSKIGCGGSAMHVSEQLIEMFGEELCSKRILFIPSGGYSQRLPSWSVLGKLFCSLPLAGNSFYQMIDLIFAVYRPFLKCMPPGVLLVSSDAIISYCLDGADCWTFNKGHFSALAHLTPLSVAKEHGVYVLDDPHDGPESTFMAVCREVLQKPSVALMREKGAVIQTVSPCTGEKTEVVYSDSVFFMDMSVVQMLAHLYSSMKPLSVEVDAYRDFLFPLGMVANMSMIQANNPVWYSIQKKLFDLFHGTPLSVCVLNQSAFHHLGTMTEYVENLAAGSLFAQHFPFQSVVMSCFEPGEKGDPVVRGTVMHSFLHHTSEVSGNSVVEYCDFDVPLHVAAKSIVSNCKLHEDYLLLLGISLPCCLPIEIPPDILIHTVPVEGGYTSICFGIKDQIKKCCNQGEIKDLLFLNRDFTVLTNKLKQFDWFVSSCKKVSVWDARIFTVCPTMDEAFFHAYQLINLVLKDGSADFYESFQGQHLSMKDILWLKKADVMLDHFKHLMQKIRCI